MPVLVVTRVTRFRRTANFVAKPCWYMWTPNPTLRDLKRGEATGFYRRATKSTGPRHDDRPGTMASAEAWAWASRTDDPLGENRSTPRRVPRRRPL